MKSKPYDTRTEIYNCIQGKQAVQTSYNNLTDISYTPSVPNYKSFQESWRVTVFQVWPNLYDKIITFMIPIKYH